VFPVESRHHKALSGRELSSKMTEGECVNVKFQLNYIAAQAPSTTSWSPSLPEGGFGEMTITAGTQKVIGRIKKPVLKKDGLTVLPP